MNIEQEREAFEAWTGYSEEALSRSEGDGYCIKGVDNEWRAYQAGRAALQSQDRVDAERYRWIKENGVASFPKVRDWMTVRIVHPMPECIDSLGKAIDHARRIEGN